MVNTAMTSAVVSSRSRFFGLGFFGGNNLLEIEINEEQKMIINKAAGKRMTHVKQNKTINRQSKENLRISFCFSFISNFYYAPAGLTTRLIAQNCHFPTGLSSGILMQ